MKCARCETSIIEGEEREHLGRILCEDCYMDTLSPAKTCDPWAVHSAKSFGKNLGGKFELTELQRKILEILKETGGAPPEHLVERLNISPMDLEREIAALRHMEKVRGELRAARNTSGCGSNRHLCLMKVPLLYSSKATFSSAWVFITMGPRQATGSPMGFPEISRNRTGSSPALTATWSPSEKRIRLSAGCRFCFLIAEPAAAFEN